MRKRQGGLLLWLLFIMVVIIFTSGAVAVYTVFLKPENVSKVPVFHGRTVNDAVSEAESLGLVIQIEPAASTLPEGLVLAQTPEAGTELRKGQVIVLQVSRGGNLHAIPDVKGKTLAQAQSEIKAQGFTLGDVVRIQEANTPAGTVIAQSPAAPASVVSGRRIDLLVQEGTAAAEIVVIPDVNRMTEQEARSVIEAAGLKVNGIDRAYSPLLPEGLAIETRPGAGTTIRAGQGVILKLATQRRPAGFMDSDSGSSQRTTTPATTTTPSKTQTTQTQAKTQPAAPAAQTPARSVTVSVQGQDDVFIGDDYAGSPTRTQAAERQQPAATSTTAKTEPAQPTPAQTPAPAQQAPATASIPAQTAPAQQAAQPAQTGGTKTARIRYQVPPIAQPMTLRIELTDPSGKRDVFNRQVRSGENVVTSANYTQECVISIYLGGEFVWQERQR